MENLKKKKKGFTLIELMAVVAIIAILAAVLVPTVNGYINRSKKTAIVSQVRSVVTAVETYNATASKTATTGTGTAAVTSGYIEDTTKVKNVIDRLGDDKDLLEITDLSKLGDMTVQEAKLINGDQNAISKIELDNGGNITKYNSIAVGTARS